MADHDVDTSPEPAADVLPAPPVQAPVDGTGADLGGLRAVAGIAVAPGAGRRQQRAPASRRSAGPFGEARVAPIGVLRRAAAGQALRRAPAKTDSHAHPGAAGPSPAKKRAGITVSSAERGQMDHDAEFMVEQLKSGLNSRAEQDMVVRVKKWAERDQRNPEGETPYLDQFIVRMKMRNFETGLFSHTVNLFDELWRKLDGQHLAEFRTLVGSSKTQKATGPSSPEEPGFVAEMAKGEALGLLATLKGITAGAGGMVDGGSQAIVKLARAAGVNLADPIQVQKWLGEQYDFMGHEWFAKDWDDNDARRIGEMGGEVLFTLTTLGAGTGAKATTVAMNSVNVITAFSGVREAGLSIVADIERLQKKGPVTAKRLLADRLFEQHVLDIASNTVGALGAGGPTHAGDAAKQKAVRWAGAHRQLILATISSVLDGREWQEVSASQKSPEEKRQAYWDVTKKLVTHLISGVAAEAGAHDGDKKAEHEAAEAERQREEAAKKNAETESAGKPATEEAAAGTGKGGAPRGGKPKAKSRAERRKANAKGRPQNTKAPAGKPKGGTRPKANGGTRPKANGGARPKGKNRPGGAPSPGKARQKSDLTEQAKKQLGAPPSGSELPLVEGAAAAKAHDQAGRPTAEHEVAQAPARSGAGKKPPKRAQKTAGKPAAKTAAKPAVKVAAAASPAGPAPQTVEQLHQQLVAAKMTVEAYLAQQQHDPVQVKLATQLSEHLLSKPFKEVTPDDFRISRARQEKVFADATKLRDAMAGLGKTVVGSRKATVVSILKRNDLDAFVQGVLEKCHRKQYTQIAQMDDMARGRMNIEWGRHVGPVARELAAQNTFSLVKDGFVAPRRTSDEKVVRYPRYHVILEDPATGMNFEWQVGTAATTKLYESHDSATGSGVGIKIPPALAEAAAVRNKKFNNDLHDVEYDIFQQFDKKYPAASKKLGIPEFILKVAKASHQSAKGAGDKRLDQNIKTLHIEAGVLLKKLVRSQGADAVVDLLH